MGPLHGKRVLITGGTGSLGKTLLRRCLSGAAGDLERIVVFSRDEAKQHAIRVEYQQKNSATDEIIYRNFNDKLEFIIGDVRDPRAITSALSGIDVVFNAAALKQVPTCEYFPIEAVRTNILGPENIVSAIRDFKLPVEIVVGISTDKAVKPVNVMGMTKSVQERVFAGANLRSEGTRFVVSRYGNVLASRGSVIPLFHEQIRNGGPVTLTSRDMTRFLLSLDEAVNLILDAVEHALPGETYIPRVPAARIVDVAEALIDGRDVEMVVTQVRPGEKIDEILVSEEEGHRTFERAGHYVIAPILPELRDPSVTGPFIQREYSSGDEVMTLEQVRDLLRERRLMVGQPVQLEGEFLA